MLRLLLLSVTILASALAAAPGFAQDYPQRDIRVLVGFPAGTGADILTRYFTERLSAKAGKPVVIENRPGALGSIASEAVARARPDGYTLLSTGANGSHAANIVLLKKLPYDPVKDFTPVTTYAKLAFIMVVDPKRTPATSIAELTTFLKAKPNANFGATSPTNTAAGELYKKIAGLNVLQVPYKATQDAVNDLHGGLIDFIFIDAVFSLERARSGQFRALAVTTAERTSWAPEIPGMREAGLPGFDLAPWWAFFGPPGMPDAITGKLVGWINEITNMPETKAFLARTGADPFPGTPQSTAAHLNAEIEKWTSILRAANIEPQ